MIDLKKRYEWEKNFLKKYLPLMKKAKKLGKLPETSFSDEEKDFWNYNMDFLIQEPFDAADYPELFFNFKTKNLNIN